MRYVLLLLLFIANASLAQFTLLTSDNMEKPFSVYGSNKISSGNNSSYIGGTSTAYDTPSNIPLYSSFDSCYCVRGLGPGASAIEYDTLTYVGVYIPASYAKQLRFRLASLAVSSISNPSTGTQANLAAGVDQTDFIEVQFSYNGGATWWSSIRIQGSSNASWGFVGSIIQNGGALSVNNGIIHQAAYSFTPTVYNSSSTGPISNIIVNFPTIASGSNIMIRFVTAVSAAGETFLVDNVELWTKGPTLPIVLSSFTGRAKNNTVELKWATSSETNNDYFSIYRSPNGLEYWQLVANVQGAGNSSMNNNYVFIDQNPFNGPNYYVLMQTDYDGRREQFPPIIILFAPVTVETLWNRYNFLGQQLN